MDQTQVTDYYARLELDRSASTDDIRDSLHELRDREVARGWSGGADSEKIELIDRALQAFASDESRRAYDASIAPKPQAAPVDPALEWIERARRFMRIGDLSAARAAVRHGRDAARDDVRLVTLDGWCDVLDALGAARSGESDADFNRLLESADSKASEAYVLGGDKLAACLDLRGEIACRRSDRAEASRWFQEAVNAGAASSPAYRAYLWRRACEVEDLDENRTLNAAVRGLQILGTPARAGDAPALDGPFLPGKGDTESQLARFYIKMLFETMPDSCDPTTALEAMRSARDLKGRLAEAQIPPQYLATINDVLDKRITVVSDYLSACARVKQQNAAMSKRKGELEGKRRDLAARADKLKSGHKGHADRIREEVERQHGVTDVDELRKSVKKAEAEAAALKKKVDTPPPSTSVNVFGTLVGFAVKALIGYVAWFLLSLVIGFVCSILGFFIPFFTTAYSFINTALFVIIAFAVIASGYSDFKHELDPKTNRLLKQGYDDAVQRYHEVTARVDQLNAQLTAALKKAEQAKTAIDAETSRRIAEADRAFHAQYDPLQRELKGVEAQISACRQQAQPSSVSLPAYR